MNSKQNYIQRMAEDYVEEYKEEVSRVDFGNLFHYVSSRRDPFADAIAKRAQQIVFDRGPY